MVKALWWLKRFETEKKLSRYAERLVSFVTLENYDLAIIATEHDDLVANLAELAARGKAVFGVKSEHLAREEPASCTTSLPKLPIAA